MPSVQRIHRFIFLGLGAAGGTFLAYSSAAAYSELCDVVPAACDYAGPDAPLLQADVCWSGTVASIKTGSCPTGTTPYHVEYGEVLGTGEVQAYISLPDACAEGYCIEPPDPLPEPLDGGEICCDDQDPPHCTLSLLDCTGDIVWCDSYTTNMDGSVDCYEFD